MSRALTDATTETVVGVRAFRERLEPESAPARGRIGDPTCHLEGDRTNWSARIDTLRQTESWIEAHPDRHTELRESLEEIPETEAVFAKLRRRERLQQADLLVLKRLGFFGREVLATADDLVAEHGGRPAWRAKLLELLETIHPDGADEATFHLDERHDPKLGELTERRREVRERRHSRRDHLESEIVDRLGGAFDFDGQYHPEGHSAEELDACEDLERVDGAWRLDDDELAELRSELERLEDRLDEVERRIRDELTETVAEELAWLEPLVETLVTVDLDLAKVRLKREIDGCWPKWLEDGPELELQGGREPRMAARLADEGEPIQPVDFSMEDGPIVVTGPNMGGKSVLLQLLGLAQWAAQHAWPVPADSFAFRPVEAIVYIGSEEPNAVDADQGLSSFGREVRRLVDRIEATPSGTLWLLDEFGRGTHPEEGAAIALEVIERLADRGDAIVAASHFPDLARSDAVETYEVRGLEESELTELAEATSAPDDLAAALRRAIDFQPEPTEAGGVPRDARRVARALGLELADESSEPEE